MNDLKLNRPYKEELEGWLYNTKSIRFSAHERCLRQNKWSNISLGLMSCYLIIINLAPLYILQIGNDLSSNIISFYNTALSILILLFSQLENSNEFKLKAEKFHTCSLEISELYRELKQFKIVENKEEEKLLKLTTEYNHILSKFENHKNIDYQYFMIEHRDKFETTFCKRIKVRVIYYFYTLFVYHFLIFAPIFVFIIIKQFKF